MYAATIETAAHGVGASMSGLAKDADRALTAWQFAVKPFGFLLRFFVKLIAKRTRRLNDRLAAHTINLIQIESAIRVESEDLIDPNFHIRDMLQDIKESSLRLRGDVQKSFADVTHQVGPNDHWQIINDEVQRTLKLFSEQFEITNRLQWLIAEHDADVAQRHEGFVASTPEEVLAMLEKF